MYCKCRENKAVEIIGLCDIDNFEYFENENDKNWTQFSIPEILQIPCEKPKIESIDKVYIDIKIISKRVIKVPEASDANGLITNEEGTFLTGRKLIIEGILCQKIVYTGEVTTQSVHSAHFNIPFSAFIMLKKDTPIETKYCVESCIEDVYVEKIGDKEIFKNVTVLLRAFPLLTCS